LDILHIVHSVLGHAGRPSIQAGRQIDTQTYCKGQTDRQAGTQDDIQTYTDRHKQTDGVQTGRHSPATTQSHGQTDRQTDRLAGRHADRCISIQT